MTAQIELQHINCKVGGKYLLHDITWRIQPGERWIVFGENGSGKTTLLSLIAGYKRYSSGTIQLFGEPYHSEQILRYRRRIGLVSTSFFNRILCKESVLSIVLSGKSGTLGISTYISNQDILRAKILLDIFHIGRKKDMPFYLLSKGEQQSVLLARAFMGKPEILLLDEADSGLDYLARIRLTDFLAAFAAETNATMIAVTHYPNEIPEFFEYGMLMKDGRIYKKGLLEDIFCTEVFCDFLNTPVEVQKQKNGYQFISKGDVNRYAELWRTRSGDRELL